MSPISAEEAATKAARAVRGVSLARDLARRLPRYLREGLLRPQILDIAALRGRHAAEPAVVLGAGPSLQISDLDRFSSRVSFASNKIYLAFGETTWRPTYYTVHDPLVAKNCREQIRQLALTKVHTLDVRSELEHDDATWLHYAPRPQPADPRRPFHFSKNLLWGVYGGWTVIFIQLQLAYWMGVRHVDIVGLDFSFDVPDSKVSDEFGGVVVGQGEVNHFHPDYRPSGETWTVPQLDKQRAAFAAALRAFEADGRVLRNASRETKLDVLPRVDFDEAFPER